MSVGCASRQPPPSLDSRSATAGAHRVTGDDRDPPHPPLHGVMEVKSSNAPAPLAEYESTTR